MSADKWLLTLSSNWFMAAQKANQTHEHMCLTKLLSDTM